MFLRRKLVLFLLVLFSNVVFGDLLSECLQNSHDCGACATAASGACGYCGDSSLNLGYCLPGDASGNTLPTDKTCPSTRWAYQTCSTAPVVSSDGQGLVTIYENFPTSQTGVYGANRIFLVVNVHYIPDLGPAVDTVLLDVSGYFSGDLSQGSGWSLNGSINAAWSRVGVFGVAEYWNPSGVDGYQCSSLDSGKIGNCNTPPNYHYPLLNLPYGALAYGDNGTYPTTVTQLGTASNGVASYQLTVQWQNYSLSCTTGTNLTDPLYIVSCSVQANQYTFENTSDSLLFGLVGGYATLSLQGTVSGVMGLSNITIAHNSSFQFSSTPNLEIFQVNDTQNVFLEPGPITWHPDIIFSTQFSGVSWVRCQLDENWTRFDPRLD